MRSTARAYFTIDLRGLRAALAARAAGEGVTESDLLRSAHAAKPGGDARPSIRRALALAAPAAALRTYFRLFGMRPAPSGVVCRSNVCCWHQRWHRQGTASEHIGVIRSRGATPSS
jgi:hypothetical protein